jgi:hypothetical protein
MKRILAIASALALALVSQTTPVSAEWGPACSDTRNTAAKVWANYPASGDWDIECGHTSYANLTEGSVADANFGNSTYEGNIENFNDRASTVKFWSQSGVDVCVNLHEDANYGGRRIQFFLDAGATTNNINLHNYGAGDQVTSMWFDKNVAGSSDCDDKTW